MTSRRSLRTALLAGAVLVSACAAPDPTGPTARAVAGPSLSWLRTSETPVITSATIVRGAQTTVKSAAGWNVVRVVWQDNAAGEVTTVAGYSDASGQWMFVTMAASADVYGAGTGTRTVDFYAPKAAAFVQLASIWAPAPTDPNHASDTTPYSAKMAITK